jgi:multiple sugar transport system permease protein
MPNIITAATIAILFSSMFGYPTGPVNDLVQTFGLSKESIYFLNEKWTAKLIVSFIQFWTWYGYTMLILISGVLGINPELFEAAEMDGASGAQSFFKITIPSIRPIMLYMLVTSLIGGLQMFDIPKLFVPNSGPDNATLTTSVFIYNQAFSGSYMYNRAAAASMLMFIIIAILSGILFFSMRDRSAAKFRKEEKKRIKAYNEANKIAARRAEV